MSILRFGYVAAVLLLVSATTRAVETTHPSATAVGNPTPVHVDEASESFGVDESVHEPDTDRSFKVLQEKSPDTAGGLGASKDSLEVETVKEEKNENKPKEEIDPNRLEWSVMPVVGGNSDVGIIFGLGGVVAKFSKDNKPYKWRLDMNASAAAASSGITMQNYRVGFNLPQLLGSRVRLIGAVTYNQLMDKGYFGIGNDAQLLSSKSAAYYRYDAKTPEVWTHAEVTVTNRIKLLGGLRFRYSIIESQEGSLLNEHQQYTDENGEPLLPGTDNHAELIFAVGAYYDTRDHEVAPTKGQFHQISTRGGPGLGTDYNFGGSTLTFRFYYSFFGEYLTFAARLMGDMIYGTPPFYELALVGAFPYFSAIGGTFGIRGIPDARYYGSIKILGNFEVRTVLVRFRIKSHRFKLGLAGFFDTGRVWTGWKPYPELDGTGIGMKFGAGGGLRAQWGETFIARIDVAYSPDANPVGAYFAVGHMF